MGFLRKVWEAYTGKCGVCGKVLEESIVCEITGRRICLKCVPVCARRILTFPDLLICSACSLRNQPKDTSESRCSLCGKTGDIVQCQMNFKPICYSCRTRPKGVGIEYVRPCRVGYSVTCRERRCHGCPPYS